MSFVREVRVTGREVLLTYTMPLSADEVTEETVGVLPTVRYGGPRCTTDRTRTFELAFSLGAT